MHLPVACLLVLLASMPAFADLSWEYVDQRTRQAKEVQIHAKLNELGQSLGR